jgi:hypothetical protein
MSDEKQIRNKNRMKGEGKCSSCRKKASSIVCNQKPNNFIPIVKWPNIHISHSTFPKVVHDTLIGLLKDNPLAKDAAVNTIMETPGDFTEASVRFWADLYAAHDTLPVVEPSTPLPGDVPFGDPGDSVSDAGSDTEDAQPTGLIPSPSAANPVSSSMLFRPPPPRKAPYGPLISPLIFLNRYFFFSGPIPMNSDMSFVGSLVSLNDNTRLAAADQQSLVDENRLLRVVDEMRKAGSPEDITKVLDIVLHESWNKLFIIKLCTIMIIIVVVLSLHKTLNPSDRLVAQGNEEQTKQAAEATKQAVEATKQAEIIALTKREEDERQAKHEEDERQAKREENERQANEMAQKQTRRLL